MAATKALASIGSISHLTITSRQRGDEAGARIEVAGGSVSLPAPIAAPIGTTVEVRRLFFNTPARRKFLKSDGAETSRVREVVQRIAAAHHETAFALRSGDRTLLNYPIANSKDRLLSIFGGELSDELIEFSKSLKGITLWGLIGTPQVARPTSRHIRIHVNGRYISDSSVTHALKEGYRGLIEPKRHPTAALFLEMDPSLVDVNVHPQKSEVRFKDREAIWRLVNTSVSEALVAREIVPAYVPSTQPSIGVFQRPAFGATNTPSFMAKDARDAVAEISFSTQTSLPTILAPDAVMQVQKCFLVTQDEEGILIIDQHALHERIMFEELKERITQGNMESQRLLVPDSFVADSGQLQSLETYAILFKKLGIDASPSGPASISVYALPTLLASRNVNSGKFIRDLLDKLGGSNLPSSEEEVLAEILDMMACKAAIKAGDSLTSREIADLLRKQKELDRGGSCPHGRPTTMRLSIEELEQRFGRR